MDNILCYWILTTVLWCKHVNVSHARMRYRQGIQPLQMQHWVPYTGCSVRYQREYTGITFPLIQIHWRILFWVRLHMSFSQ